MACVGSLKDTCSASHLHYTYTSAFFDFISASYCDCSLKHVPRCFNTAIKTCTDRLKNWGRKRWHFPRETIRRSRRTRGGGWNCLTFLSDPSSFTFRPILLPGLFPLVPIVSRPDPDTSNPTPEERFPALTIIGRHGNGSKHYRRTLTHDKVMMLSHLHRIPRVKRGITDFPSSCSLQILIPTKYSYWPNTRSGQILVLTSLYWMGCGTSNSVQHHESPSQRLLLENNPRVASIKTVCYQTINVFGLFQFTPTPEASFPHRNIAQMTTCTCVWFDILLTKCVKCVFKKM